MTRVSRSFASLLAVLALTLPIHADTKNDTKNTEVDLNHASMEELVTLPQVGPSIAQRIIEYREVNGGFRRVEDLLNVRGIGVKTFDRLKDDVTVGETSKDEVTVDETSKDESSEESK